MLKDVFGKVLAFDGHCRSARASSEGVPKMGSPKNKSGSSLLDVVLLAQTVPGREGPGGFPSGFQRVSKRTQTGSIKGPPGVVVTVITA